jgi:acyl dehydratase
MAIHSMTLSAVKKGDLLPGMTVSITEKMIIMGAAASRDWQPIHHSKEWATSEAGLPSIIMNNYTQAGWISRYITDWSGPDGRLGKMAFSMRKPICPDDNAVFTGEVSAIEVEQGCGWLHIEIAILVLGEVKTKGWVRLAVPLGEGAQTPWCVPLRDWRP